MFYSVGIGRTYMDCSEFLREFTSLLFVRRTHNVQSIQVFIANPLKSNVNRRWCRLSELQNSKNKSWNMKKVNTLHKKLSYANAIIDLNGVFFRIDDFTHRRHEFQTTHT